MSASRHQALLDAGKMHLDDGAHGVGVGKADVVEEAAAQERVRQFLFVVGGDDHDRPAPGVDGFAGLVDEELHAVEFLQKIVRELDVGLVDLVDQQHRPLVGGERIPQLAALDVVADVLDAGIAQLAVAQPRHRVVLVKALQRLGGRFDVPLDQRRGERLGDLDGQHGLAGAGLAFDQERPLQRDRGVDRDFQIVGRHVGAGAFKAHAFFPSVASAIKHAAASAHKARNARERVAAISAGRQAVPARSSAPIARHNALKLRE